MTLAVDPLAPAIPPPDPAAVGFVLELGHALHTYGESAQRIEDILGAMSTRLGLPGAQFFSSPTSIIAAFGPLGAQRTHLLRVEPGEANLSKLAAVDRVSVDVAQGRRTPGEGRSIIAEIAARPAPYGAPATILAHGAVSGAACQFLGGGVREVQVAALLGLGLGLFSLVGGGHIRARRVFEPVASFLVAVVAVALAHVLGPISLFVATLAGLIVLIPGFTLTTAMNELATRQLASGTARLSGAGISFLGIAFGVALGTRIGTDAMGMPALGAQVALPPWAALAALAIAPISFVVILRADLRDAPFIVATGGLAVVAGRVGTATLGVELGAFVGALAVALASRAYERLRDRPAAVVLVPGILLLVPGSLGFRSLAALMERQALTGIETAFSMILTAVALVAGLLVAGVVVPERGLR